MRDPHPALPAAGTGTAARSRVSPGLPECSPVPGDAAPLWGKHPAPGTQPGSRGHCLTAGMQPCSPGCSRVPGMEPGSREHRLAARMQSGTRECSSAPGDAASLAPANAAGFRGTQPLSRERPPARSEGRPFCPRHQNSRENQVSCSPNCACHRALRGHPGITRTAHAFK